MIVSQQPGRDQSLELAQPATAAAPVRYHHLDALRAVAMLLGIVIHAAMSFLPIDPLMWPAVDRSRGLWSGLLLVGIHAFRMQVFFLMAGFFAHMLLDKRGVGGFISHRAKRIVLPLALGVVLLLPIIQAIFIWEFNQPGRSARFVAGDLVFDFTHFQMSFVDYYRSGAVLKYFNWSHLWFLVYLIVLYVLFLAVLPISRRVLAWNWPNRWFRWVVGSAWKPLVLAAPTFLLLLPMNDWGADTPLYAWPEPRIVFYYALFFGFGWVLWRHRDLVDALGNRWKTNLASGVFLALPIYLALAAHGPLAMKNMDERFRLPALLAYAVLTWLLVLGFTGMFIRVYHSENRVMRYLSDSAYWLYLAHLPLVIVLQKAVADWPVWGPLKFMLINVVSITLLLLSYEYGVRHTFIGAILNGRKAPKNPRFRSKTAKTPVGSQMPLS